MHRHGLCFLNNADAMGAKSYVQSHTPDTRLTGSLSASRGMLSNC